MTGGFFSTVGTRPELPAPAEADPSYQSGFALLPTPPGAPGLTVTRGDGSALVTVTPPAYDGGAPITLYTVTVSPGGASATLTDSGSITFSGLTNGTQYTISATATSSVGTSPAAIANVTPVTSVHEPGAPGVSVTPGDGSALVTVTAPAYDGGAPVTLYTVSVDPGGASATLTAPGSIILSGLTNGTSYTISVTATSSAGTGPATVVNITPGTSVRDPEPPPPPAPKPRPVTPDPPAVTGPRPPPPHHS